MLRRIALIMTLLPALALSCALPAGAQTRTFVAYEGSYSAGTVYNVNDMVSMGNDFFISLVADNTNNPPPASTSQWALVGAGSGVAGAAGPMGATGPMGLEGPAGAGWSNGASGACGCSVCDRAGWCSRGSGRCGCRDANAERGGPEGLQPGGGWQPATVPRRARATWSASSWQRDGDTSWARPRQLRRIRC